MDDGDVRVLNVGAGNIKLSFDKSNPAERIRAARIVTDMLRRGFALLVEVGRGDDGRPIYQRAHSFDEEKCEYIIADYDPLVGQRADADEAAGIERLTMSRVEAGATEGTEVTAHAGDDGEAAAAGGGEAAAAGEEAPARRGKRKYVRRAAEGSRVVAVGRSAGG